MRAAAYLRVSTKRQSDDDRFGLEVQLAAVRAFAPAAGLELLRTYQDAISGTLATRQALEALLTDARQYQAVVIPGVDRLARRIDVALGVLGELRAAGLRVYAADMGEIDLEENGSLFNFILRSTFAHADHISIASRLHAARNAKARRGQVPIGVVPYGYKWSKELQQPVVVPQEAEVLRFIFRRAAEVSIRRVVAELAERYPPPRRAARWHHSLVSRALRNPAYKGEYRYGGPHTRRAKEQVVIPVPAVVTPEEWQAAQTGAAHPGRNPRALSGHLFCGVCGRRMGVSPVASRYGRWHFYRCNSRSARAPCGNAAVSADKLERLVEPAIRQALRDPEVLSRMLAARADAPGVDLGLKAVQEEEERWLEAFRVGAISASELGAYRSELSRRRAALRRAREAGPDLGRYAEAAGLESLRELVLAADVRVVWFSPAGEQRVEVELL